MSNRAGTSLKECPLHLVYHSFWLIQSTKKKSLSRIFIGLKKIITIVTKNCHRCDKKLSQARQCFVKPIKNFSDGFKAFG